jgi:hypothetical protein
VAGLFSRRRRRTRDELQFHREALIAQFMKPGASIAQATAEAEALWRPFIERAVAGVPGGLRDEVLSRRVGAVSAAGGNYRYLVQAAQGDPMRLASAIERAVREVEPALRVREVVPYSTIIDRSMPAERILATLGSLFGVLALIVAGGGIFGLLAWQVARRTSELGLRMVLGATRRSMVGLVTSDVAWMLVPGLAAGAIGAHLLTDFARGVLFGLTPTDPRAYGAAVLLLALAAFVAAWGPARRAAALDPLTVLRHE